MTDFSDQHCVAVHEAGHALLAYCFDLLPDDSMVSIVETADWRGVCSVHNPLSSHSFDFRYGNNTNLLELREEDAKAADLNDRARQALYREEVEHSAMAMLAGWAANSILDPNSEGPDDEDADYHAAEELIEALVESRDEKADSAASVRHYWAWLDARTRLILEQYWGAVLALAELLKKEKTITGASARTAIQTQRAEQFGWSDLNGR